MKKKVEKCKKILEYIIERWDEGDYIINGKNVMKIPVAGLYNFSFQLLDMLFTKEELAKSLLYKSKKK